MKNKIIRALIALSFFASFSSSALELLSDESLSQVEGQSSLFTTDYIAPGGSNPNVGIGFYRLGLEAEISINTNIKSMRLGCDAGPVATALCDINLQEVRLTGLNGGSGPDTDAVLTRPFFEFAIRNPDSSSSRELLGIRFGAAEAIGRITIGGNANPADASDDYGFQSLSGDMNAQIKNASISNICADVLGLFCLYTTATLDDYDYKAVHGGTPLIFQRSQATGCGSPDATQKNCMFFDGLVAHAALFGLTLDSQLTENLRFIHDLGIEDGTGGAVEGLSMSLQKEAIKWQSVTPTSATFTGVTAAQKGWWISIPNVVVRDLVINDAITVDALGALTGQTVDLYNLDLGQLPADNCYGSLSFC